MESSCSRNKVYEQVTKIPQEGKDYQLTEEEETNFCLREPGKNCRDGFFFVCFFFFQLDHEE